MSRQAIDMIGVRVGRLEVISRAKNTSQNKAQWLCKCDCGNEIVVSRRHLIDSSTLSCGCYAKEIASQCHTKHGMKGTRLYRIWAGMKDRCLNHKSKYWHMYGGRGIDVCDEWKNSFESFMYWSMSNGYKDDLTIDRIENDKGYYPSNCRWATYKEQENNRRNNRLIQFGGETHTISEWEEITGIDSCLISQRLYYGWSIERALTQKPRRRNKICQQN